MVVRMRATNSLPVALCVPKDFRRHKTARRKGRSALLFVGSTPSTRTKVQSASHTLRTCWQVWRVFSWLSWLPACNSFLILVLMGVSRGANGGRKAQARY